MEKKLPEDNLERFIRSSFEDYKHQPSNKVWDRIEAGLEVRPLLYKRIKPWMYWSAAAAVLTAIIFFQFKSNQSLNKQLEKVLQQNRILSEQAPLNADTNTKLTQILPSDEMNAAKKDTEGQTELDKIATTPSTEQQQQDQSIQNPEGKSGKSEPITSDLSKNVNTIDSITSSPGIAKTNKLKDKLSLQDRPGLNLDNKTSPRDQPKKQAGKEIQPDNKPSIPFPGGKQKSNPAQNLIRDEFSAMDRSKQLIPGQIQAVPDSSFMPNQVEENLYSVRTIYPVSFLNPQSIRPILSTAYEGLNYNDLVMIPILLDQKLHRSTGMEVGLLGGVLYEKGEITPKRYFDPRIIDFPKNEYNSSNSWQAELELSKSLGNRWALSSGVGIKHFEFINELTQSLAFKNREQPKPGNLPSQHDFHCKLPGPSGTSDIIINSEQLDSRASISDAEQIKITIKNQSRLNYFTVPLALAFHLNKGRWSAFAKTGFQADIFLSRTVDEPQITLSHPQLQLRKDRPTRPPMVLHRANPLVINGIVSAGLKYQVATAWSLNLSPGIIWPFTSREINRDIKVDSKIYSLQLGINYSLGSL